MIMMGLIAAAVLGGTLAPLDAGDVDPGMAARRRPVALAVVDTKLYCANRQSGSISVVDLQRLEVEREVRVGESLADIAVLDARRLVAVDHLRHEWILVEVPTLRVVRRAPVARFPASICVAPCGAQFSIASLWSRRVTIVDRAGAGDEGWVESHVVDLPFAPREQWLSPGGDRLVAADAFGGRLAVLDPRQGRIVAQRSIAGHNVGGLATALDGQSLLVSHQILNGRASTTRDMVFWGTVLGNVVRGVAFDELFDPERTHTDVAHWTLLPLGSPGDATGDPDAIVLTTTGKTAVALAGVDQVSISSAPRSPMLRLGVGRRPVDLAVSGDQQRLFVCNMLDDSISVIDFATLQVAAVVPLGATPPPTSLDRGERYFFDARLSLDGWYSCHSCHTDGHANGLVNDNLGDGSFGAPKRVPSLLGTADTGPWAWNGSQAVLAEQIHKSITATMRGPAETLDDDVPSAIAEYLRSLAPAVALDAARGTPAPHHLADRGRDVFARAGCIDCHAPPAYTTRDTYDVALADEHGQRLFNPPSLRGVSQRTSLFHDGRATSLEQALVVFRHGGVDRLSAADRDALLAFLRGL